MNSDNVHRVAQTIKVGYTSLARARGGRWTNYAAREREPLDDRVARLAIERAAAVEGGADGGPSRVVVDGR